MEKPTQDLFEEHGGIILMLKIMGKVAERLKKGEEVKREHLNKIVEFLRNFADKCHHGKEEGILFPEIAKNKFNVQMIYEFLGEHKSGRDYIRGIAEGLKDYETGNPEAYHIAKNMTGYIQLLNHHIQEENTKLFPTAEKNFL